MSAQRMYVMRSESTAPGSDFWLELGGDYVFVVSADGVTQEGADCLQEGLVWHIDRGLWRPGRRGGALVVTSSERAETGNVVCEVNIVSGKIDLTLSADHFDEDSTRAIGVALSEALSEGWRRGKAISEHSA